MTDVLLPQLGETVTEGTITRWTKQVGDAVAADEVLFEVSTDKVDSEVPSPAAGVITEIRVQEGETADVGAVLAVIGEAGSAAGSDGGSSAEPTPVAKVEAEPSPEATNTTNAALAQEEAAQDRSSSPAPAPAAAQNGGGGSSDQSPGLGGKVLSPVVRKLISENNLDVNAIQGTGIGGRITRDDVQNHMGTGSTSGGQSAQAPTPQQTAPDAPQRTPYPAPGTNDPSTESSSAPAAPARAPRQAPPLPVPTAGQRDEVVPFSNIRRRTAEHMIMSQATSAHTLVTIEVDYENVDRVRRAKKDKFKQEEGTSLTYLPFITRAIVDALEEFPYVNASVGNNELIVHRDVNVGIAVDLAFEGLLVPVLPSADGLRLRQIARGISDLAHRARNKKLQADDISGGTITITNAGGYGTLITYPVINQPQVAIISTDGVKKKPVAIELADGSDAIVVHPVGVLGLAWDHRAFDGAYASAFIAKVKEVLETRDWDGEL